MALVLLGALPVLAGFVGMAWEFSQLAGLIAALSCIWLCGAPVRPRDSSPPTLLSLRSHTVIGWAAVGAVSLHIGGLVLADRNVLEYLKPSMPIYMAAGVLAAIGLLLLASSAPLPIRRHVWSNHRGFQASHVIAGGILISLVAVHVVATGRYTGGRARDALMVGATVGAMLMLLRPGRPNRPDTRGRPGHPGKLADGAADRARRLVFGRRSAWVAGALVSITGGLMALVMSATGTALREPLASRMNSLSLDFPHAKHVQVNCLTCHHNYADGKGFENCVMCHKSRRNDLKAGVQARFHAFCFECHRHPKDGLSGHGPVSGCASCHHAPGGADR